MKKWRKLSFTAAALAVVFFSSVPAVFAAKNSADSENTPLESAEGHQVHQVTYHIVTKKRFETSTGKRGITVYQFRPAVYVVNQDDDVTLNLKGIATGDCPVVLEAYGMRGTIHPNKPLQLHFTATKPGIFKLKCPKHADEKHQGPMEGFLVVIPKNR